MSETELRKFCEKSCLEYKQMFGYYPEVRNYFCTPEEYIDGLKKSIDEKKELCNYIRQIRPNN